MRRAGITNIGSRTSASSVIDHDSRSITARVSTSAMTLVTTPDSVKVNARWAPITSLLSRLTRAPVRVRVKNATGIRCTCPNTARRRSRMTPSPIFADSHRSTDPEGRGGDGDHRDGDRQRHHAAGTAVGRDLVDDLAGEHRRGDREHGADHRQHEEHDQLAEVRPGEREHAAKRGAVIRCCG